MTKNKQKPSRTKLIKQRVNAPDLKPWPDLSSLSAINSSFPAMGIPQPAHLGSQSMSPNNYQNTDIGDAPCYQLES